MRRSLFTSHLPGPGGERGSVTLFVVVAGLGLFLAIGLVVDGAGLVHAQRRADVVAAEAARAAGQVVDPHGRYDAGARARGDRAERAGDAYLARVTTEGWSGGNVVVDGDVVTVTTHLSYAPIFLSAVGAEPIPVEGEAQARLLRDVQQEASQ